MSRHRTKAALQLLLVAGAGLGCGEKGLEPGQRDLEHPSPAAFFADDFESGLRAHWSREERAPNVVAVVMDPLSAGNQVASMHLDPGVTVNGASRCEVAFDNQDVPGTIGWYHWRVLLPTDYGEPDDTTGRDGTGRPLWQIMGQWHDQPNTAAGETWDTYPAHSPPIAAHYGTVGGRPSLVIIVGVAGHETTLGPFDLAHGAWHDLLWHIGWSTGDDGFVAVWLDGVPLATQADGTALPHVEGESRVVGRTMYNRAPHFLKLGLYRNPTLAFANTVYFDDVAIAASRDAAVAGRQP